MAVDRRVEFVQKWYQRARESTDDFDRFFYLWIALIAAAQRFRTSTGRHVDEDTDGRRVVDYCKGNTQSMLRVLEQHRHNMRALARRKGTQYRNPIVDTGNPVLREHCRQLSQHYLENKPLSDEDLVVYVAELLNKIRNNLFHGVKVYDDASDSALLQEVNPILTSIINQCEHVSA
jgi:hypothetical protein